MPVKNVPLIFLIFLIITNISLAGAWTQKKGGGFYKLDFRFLNAEKIYDRWGNKTDIPEFSDMTLGLYSEYGVSDALTLFGSWSAYKVTKIDSAKNFSLRDEISGTGDGLIGVKLRLAQFGSSVLSSLISFGIPAGISTPDGNIITGDGEFDQTIGIQFGYSLYPVPSYLNLSVRFSNRINGFSDEFGYGFEAGYDVLKSLTLIVRLNGLYSLKNGDPQTMGGFGIFANNTQFIAYSAGLNYEFTDRFGLSAAYESGTAGRNIISAPVVTLGIFFTH